MLSIFLAGCTGTSLPTGSLPFTTLEQKNDPGYIGQQQYFALEPGLLVLFNEESALEEGDLFSEDARQALRRLNYDTHFALAVFQGWQPAPGFGVEIRELVLEAGRLVIRADFRQPGSTAQSDGAVTSPYHLITVRRPGGGLESLLFQLEVAGELQAVFPNPTP